MAKKLYGTDPDQVPTNADLGTMAYQDVNLFTMQQDTNGDFIVFRQGGTEVGVISSSGGSLLVGEGSAGLKFNSGSTKIIPRGTNNQNVDGTIDLGGDGDAWKDLYLSGGVYLGGTGSANYLDGYEEGGFSPFSGIGSGYTGEVVENAQYTKIGRMVYINLRMKWTGTDGSGNPAVFVMPFTHGTATNTGTTGAIMYSGTQLRSGAAIIAHMATGQSNLYLYSGAGGAFSAITRAELNGTYDFAISFCYYVA